ncbi:Coq4 family protein [Phenylobacterium sp.]|uniref:Coq4 family protein n=1 Tax=Phenylobacterium sp. TaxID=1871053 RepID=UPI0027362398|nr:Coq4 family protein [Phenylobacterium sp.]MDP3852210.1 Coq4 family protein [Phenylobacterium sp.]
MTVATQDCNFERSGSRSSYRRDWVRAFRALRRLLANKDDTQHVFEIMRALSGRSELDGYSRLLKSPRGGRLAYERVELVQRLMDRSRLDAFAPGTVGAAYAEFTARENLSAEGLAEESRKGVAAEEVDEPHPLAWYGRRIRDSHDLWHILTGYGRDGLGEACLVAFSYAQTRSLGWAFIALGLLSRAGDTGLPVRRAIIEGYRRGRSAVWLPGEDYEHLMAEPLAAARARLGLGRAPIYQSVPVERRDIYFR